MPATKLAFFKAQAGLTALTVDALYQFTVQLSAPVVP